MWFKGQASERNPEMSIRISSANDLMNVDLMNVDARSIDNY